MKSIFCGVYLAALSISVTDRTQGMETVHVHAISQSGKTGSDGTPPGGINYDDVEPGGSGPVEAKARQCQVRIDGQSHWGCSVSTGNHSVGCNTGSAVYEDGKTYSGKTASVVYYDENLPHRPQC